MNTNANMLALYIPIPFINIGFVFFAFNNKALQQLILSIHFFQQYLYHKKTRRPVRSRNGNANAVRRKKQQQN